MHEAEIYMIKDNKKCLIGRIHKYKDALDYRDIFEKKSPDVKFVVEHIEP